MSVVSMPKRTENQRAGREMHRSLRSQFNALKGTYDALLCQFILAELDLAITFSRVAATTSDEARKKANRANARIAYQAAVHCLQGASLTVGSMREIREKTATLKSLWPIPVR
jgi:hypothetical protein